LRVELLDDVLGDGAIGKLDEGESTRTTRLPIDRHDDVGRLGDTRKVSAQIRFGRAVGEVPDEQTDCQSFLV
jgi:hypothetical protein